MKKPTQMKNSVHSYCFLYFQVVMGGTLGGPWYFVVRDERAWVGEYLDKCDAALPSIGENYFSLC